MILEQDAPKMAFLKESWEMTEGHGLVIDFTSQSNGRAQSLWAHFALYSTMFFCEVDVERAEPKWQWPLGIGTCSLVQDQTGSVWIEGRICWWEQTKDWTDLQLVRTGEARTRLGGPWTGPVVFFPCWIFIPLTLRALLPINAKSPKKILYLGAVCLG